MGARRISEKTQKNVKEVEKARTGEIICNYLIIIYNSCGNTSAYCFPEVDNFLATNSVATPNIAAVNAIRPKNSTSAKNKPRPCCARAINARIDAPPATRTIRSRRPPTIHSPIDSVLFTTTPPYIHSLF